MSHNPIARCTAYQQASWVVVHECENSHALADVAAVTGSDGTRAVSVDCTSEPLTPKEARELAACLLAAATVAERMGHPLLCPLDDAGDPRQ